MPVIPLLRQPGPLNAAPAAVLDNQRRPTVNVSAQARAVGNVADAARMPEVDARDAMAPVVALGAVGAAVSRAGGVMQALAIKQAEAETDVQVAEADQAMRDAYGKHAAWRTTTPDTALWDQNLNETLGQARSTIEKNPHLSRAARDAIRLRADKFVGDAKINLLQDKATSTFARANSTYRARTNELLSNKDWDGAIANAEEAEQKMYGFPHETQRIRDIAKQGREGDKVNTAYDAAINAPQAVLDDPDKFTSGIDDAREVKNILATAKQAQRESQSSSVDMLSDRMASGEFVTLNSLQQAFPDSMRPTVRKQFEGAWLRMQQPGIKAQLEKDAPMNYARFTKIAEDYKSEDDPEGIRWSQLNLAVKNALPEILANPILSTMSKKRPGAVEVIDAPAPLKSAVRDIVDTMFDNGVYGQFEEMAPRTSQYAPIVMIENPQKKAEALAKKGNAMIYMDQWMAENPKAKPDEALLVLRAFNNGKAPAIRSSSTPPPRQEPPNLSVGDKTSWERDLPEYDDSSFDSILWPAGSLSPDLQSP